MRKSNLHPLQSKEWAGFRKAWGNEILETKQGILTLHKIPLTSYKIGVFEKGPAPTREMTEELKKLGKKEDIIFIKLEPNIAFGESSMKYVASSKEKTEFIKLLKENGAVEGKRLFTTTTFWIDLTKSEGDLLKSFSSKTRYNIRLAEKKGVKVSLDDSDTAFEKYLELTFETTKRQGFYAHTPKYHRLMWKHLHHEPRTMNHEPIAHLLVAKYKGEIISAWILFAYEGFLYYPYGASTDKYKEVMANNLMMWEAIKFGKKLGLHTFDLWGREPGKGFTRFKEGYNPQVVEFLGTWDLVINFPLYRIYQVAEKIRWLLLKAKTKIN